MNYIKIETNDDTRSKRRVWRWTKRQEKRSVDVLEAVNRLRDYWPLTLRQIYYQLISANAMSQRHWIWKVGTINIYDALGPLAKRMRIETVCPGMQFTTNTGRSVINSDMKTLNNSLRPRRTTFLNGYDRCLAQGQPRHIENLARKERTQTLHRTHS